MGHIDRQRISAVKKLQELGLAWFQGTWQTVASDNLVAEADAMHAQLVKRADELLVCKDGSPEEAELAEIANVLEAYETKRWPEGRIPGGKG
jgi:hypothetical protein